MADCYALVTSSLNIERTEEEKLAQVFIQEANNYFKGISGKVYAVPSLRKGRDMDLVIWMHFDNFHPEFLTGFINNPNLPDQKEYKFAKKRQIWFNSVLLVIELKKHDTADSIQVNNGKLFVRYHNNWHNASDQNFEQVFALRTFLQDRLDLSIKEIPKIQNLIWLYRCPSTLEEKDEIGNVIWGNLDFNKLLQKLVNLQKPVSFDEGINVSYSAARQDSIQILDNYFNELIKEKAIGLGIISRNKLNLITQKSLDVSNKSYFKEIGEKLTIIKGNPGTGKTIHLIQIAFELKRSKDLNPIILTFNRALVQDIERIMVYSGLHDAINITTIHAFFLKILFKVGIIKKEENDENLFTNYESYLNELKNLGTQKEIKEFVDNEYDIVLIDEAQDCLDIEKDLIFILFGFGNVVVSYGNKQVVRNKELDWSTKVPSKQRNTTTLEISHRNKQNLVDYFNNFSYKLNNDLSWNLKENRQLSGGNLKLFVGNDAYKRSNHSQLVNQLVNAGYSMYDMMFLVPYNEGPEAYGIQLEEKITAWGYKGFNATIEENKRKYFPVDEHRIINFKSCRGLEAWYLVCWKLDTIVRQIKSYYKHDNNSQLSTEEGLKITLDNWLFMMFTRAIDTLIITFDDDQTQEAKMIIELAEATNSSHMAEVYY